MASVRLPKATFVLGDIREIKLQKKFELVMAWNCLFHLNHDDQIEMFKIFSEHSKLDTILLFTTGHEYGEIWSDNGGENLYHASFSEDEYKNLLAKYGFELLEHKLSDESCNDHSVWIARKV